MNETIEDLVKRELKELCATCFHADTCFYHKINTKKVIQCELFEIDYDQISDSHSMNGLCTSCDHANHCKLPGRKLGVWRCNEFS